MEAQVLRDRMMYLAGQFDEAKKIYSALLGEVNENSKKQVESEPSKAVAEPNTPVC